MTNNQEIEHRFLVDSDAWKQGNISKVLLIQQAYPQLKATLDCRSGQPTVLLANAQGHIWQFNLPEKDVSEIMHYLAFTPNNGMTVSLTKAPRLRIQTDVDTGKIKALATWKSPVSDTLSKEWEYELSISDAEQMVAQADIQLEKCRSYVNVEGFIYHVDVFMQENAPLVLAEIELPKEGMAFPKPQWLGKELIREKAYSNYNLAKTPYSTW